MDRRRRRLIARGSFGQPWIFNQTRALLEGSPVPATPPVEERFEVAIQHARMADAYEMDPRGAAIEFRKHLGWYVKGIPGSADLRRKLHQVVSLGEVEEILGQYILDRNRGDVTEDEGADSARVAVSV